MDKITSEPLPPRVKDIRGMTFGRLTALRFVRLLPNKGGSIWFFRCECGTEKECASSSVRAGSIKSCGCLNKERTTKHGFYGSRTYNTWTAMKRRCNAVAHFAYPRYGGRGIKICERWEVSFSNFLEDMGERPNGMTIDRIDNDLGYFKENCRWASPKEQRMNCDRVHMISWNGETRHISEWMKITGVKITTIRERIKRGWPIEHALTRAPSKKRLASRKIQ